MEMKPQQLELMTEVFLKYDFSTDHFEAYKEFFIKGLTLYQAEHGIALTEGDPFTKSSKEGCELSRSELLKELIHETNIGFSVYCEFRKNGMSHEEAFEALGA